MSETVDVEAADQVSLQSLKSETTQLPGFVLIQSNQALSSTLL